MKLIAFDEENNPFKKNRYVSAYIQIYDNNNLVFKNYKEAVLVPKQHSFGFLFSHLNEGDSAVFMLDTALIVNKIPLLKNVDFDDDFVRVEVKVYQYSSENITLEDSEMEEQRLLKAYLKDESGFVFKNGLYIKPIQEGEGKPIKHGNVIRIHYKGRFINRLIFDNTYKTMDFTFTYGTPGQVIKGLDIALSGMKKGEKSKIIITSQLAFGEEGSSTQVVPPFTSVIYELEIVNVK